MSVSLRRSLSLGRSPLRLIAAGGVAATGLAMTGTAVFAGLNAQAANTAGQSVTSGTLKLTMAAGSGSAGFTTSVAGMAPGDVVNRYVTLTNGGSLDGNGLSLAVADATPTKLTTDATNGLHVTVTQCSGTGAAWSASTGACTVTSGTPTTSVLLNNVAASTLGTAQTLVSGTVAAGAVLPLQVSVALPNQSETTVNGVLPTGSIQNLTASLTWTFNESQRTATNTNS